MFYLKSPASPATVINQFTGKQGVDAEGKPTMLSWAELIRFLCATQGYRQALDIFDAYDTRKRLLEMAPGTYEPVEESVRNVFVKELRTCFAGADPMYSPECLEMFRGITDARTTKPEE